MQGEAFAFDGEKPEWSAAYLAALASGHEYDTQGGAVAYAELKANETMALLKRRADQRVAERAEAVKVATEAVLAQRTYVWNEEDEDYARGEVWTVERVAGVVAEMISPRRQQRWVDVVRLHAGVLGFVAAAAPGAPPPLLPDLPKLAAFPMEAHVLAFLVRQLQGEYELITEGRAHVVIGQDRLEGAEQDKMLAIIERVGRWLSAATPNQ